MTGISHDPDDDVALSARGHDIIRVYLTCVGCGKVQIIHVNRNRELPPKVYWNCFDCQKS